MPKRIQEIWECHLCGDTLNVTENGSGDWIELAIADPNSFGKILERVICASCAKEIKSR